MVETIQLGESDVVKVLTKYFEEQFGVEVYPANFSFGYTVDYCVSVSFERDVFESISEKEIKKKK